MNVFIPTETHQVDPLLQRVSYFLVLPNRKTVVSTKHVSGARAKNVSTVARMKRERHRSLSAMGY